MLKTLLKTRLQMLFLGMSGRKKTNRLGKERSSKSSLIVLAILLPLVFLIYLYMLLSFFRLTASVTSAMGMRWLHYALASGVAILLAVFGSVFSTQSQLFDAQDNELLLSMPIKPVYILASRLLLVYLLNLVFSVLVMLPCGIAAIEAFGCTALGVAGYVLLVLLLPLLSTAICCLLGWLLSLLTAKINNKAIMSTILTVVFLVVFYIVYFRFINLAFDEDGNAVEKLAAMMANLEPVFSTWLAPLYWIGKLFADGSLLCGLGVLAVTVLPFALALCLLSRSFFKIVATKSGAKKRIYQTKEMKVSSLRRALVKRELKHFVSSATYMTNCGLGLLFLLALGVFLLIKQDMVAVLSATLLPALGLPQGSEVVIAVAAMVFLGFVNNMTAPSVSLEGKSRWIAQSIPADLSNVLFAKVDMQLLLTAPVILFASVAAAIAFRMTGLSLLLVLVLPQIVNLLAALAGLWLNLLMPKYDWPNENVPIKQSAPVAIMIFGMMLYAMLPAGLYFLLLRPYLSPFAMLGIFGGISAVLCIALWLWIRKNGEKRFLAG